MSDMKGTNARSWFAGWSTAVFAVLALPGPVAAFPVDPGPMDSPINEGSSADTIGNLMNVDGGCKKRTHGSSSTLSGDFTAHVTAAARVNSYKCPWYKPDYNQQAVVAGGGSTLFPGKVLARSDQWSGILTCTFNAGDACQILDGDIEYFDTCGSTWVIVAVYANTPLGQRLAASHSKSASGCY